MICSDSKKTSKYQRKKAFKKNNSSKKTVKSDILIIKSCSTYNKNCSRYGRQNQEISVCQMRNCRKSKNMLEHCDNNNSVLCANNNTTKKFKKENRRSKKEARSSYTSDENVISDGKAKPPLSTNKTSETVVLDSSPAQHSNLLEVSIQKHTPLNRISSCPQSESSTSSTYYPPPVLKWPSSSVRENKLSRSGSDTTCCRPPPNRTILKIDGGVIISESEEQYVINDEAGSCRPVDEQTLNKLVRDRPSSGKSKSLPSRSDKGAKPSRNPKSSHYENQPFLSVNVPSPPRYNRGPPPEYSEPPDYYSVV